MDLKKLGTWRTSLLFSGLCGVLIAAIMMFVAWQHNPQGVIFDQAGVHWKYWMVLGCFWFALAFLVIFLPFLMLKIIVYYRQNR